MHAPGLKTIDDALEVRGRIFGAFENYDLGTMATVARFRAVAWLGPLRVGGAVAWLLWLVVHLAFLTGFKNRVATIARWAIAFLGRGRPERTITEQQVLARTRGMQLGPAKIPR